MKFTLATKQHMTQIFGEDGVVHPVTVIKTGDMVVTQIKTKLKDGYESTLCQNSYWFVDLGSITIRSNQNSKDYAYIYKS